MFKRKNKKSVFKSPKKLSAEKIEAFKKTLQEKELREEEKPQAKKNSLPSDKPRDLIDPLSIEIDKRSDLVVRCIRTGEYDLPKIDVRIKFNSNNSYSGFTKQGFFIDTNKLEYLVEILNIALDEIKNNNLILPEEETNYSDEEILK